MQKSINNLIEKLIKAFFLLLERLSSFHITYHLRPKHSNNISLKDSDVSNVSDENIAIVMQGPLITKDNFTLETLKLYLKFFPSCHIFLSTWETEEPLLLKLIEDLGIKVILNKKPSYSGLSNINFQIISTSQGIIEAKNWNCKYVLKTRTDQRIYSKNSINLCYLAIKKFPVLHGYPQKERIVSFNLNSFKYRLYGLSDMINFGHIDDMCKYWCVDCDIRTHEDIGEAKTLLDFSRQRFAEVYFLTSFLNNIERPIKWTLEDSWNVIREHFIVLDTSSIDLLWKKYTHKEFRHENYKLIHNTQLNFSDWLIFQNKLPNNIPEHIIKIELDKVN